MRRRHSDAWRNLRETIARFDELVILDNSADIDRGIPENPTIDQVLERGHTTYQRSPVPGSVMPAGTPTTR